MPSNGTQSSILRLYLVVGCGTAIGSLLRFLSGIIIVSVLGLSPLLPTAFVNIVGSFIIMFFATLTGPDGRILAGPGTRQFVMGGICGGFTTFSAMSLDSFVLFLERDFVSAGLYLTAVIMFSPLAAWIGHALATWINK